ncbi:MAG: cystathionine gamma-synthase [Tessaracoccus sp.]
MAELGEWTKAMRTGLGTDPAQGAVVPPIYLSSNYAFEAPGRPRQYDYSRSGNPTRDLLGEAVAELEGGAGATILASGLAAITLIAEAYVPTGGRVVVQHDAYGGSWRLFTMLANQGRFIVDFVDFNSDDYDQALASGADLVWIETPSNPLLRITDIEAAAAAAHEAGALVVADNTFLCPLLQQPLKLGADLVIHSTTKFLNGHSDVVGGAVVASTTEQHENLRLWANALGLTASPLDSYLTLRGLRTLDARLRVHDENARALVELFDGHPAVVAVHYPGLPGHVGHDIASRQQSGFGSLFSIDLGSWEACHRFLDGLEIFHLAESLGGIESLVCHPETMTHAGMSPEAREVAGITPGMLRFSVGLEGRDDLVNVVSQALNRALDGR